MTKYLAVEETSIGFLLLGVLSLLSTPLFDEID